MLCPWFQKNPPQSIFKTHIQYIGRNVISIFKVMFLVLLHSCSLHLAPRKDLFTCLVTNSMCVMSWSLPLCLKTCIHILQFCLSPLFIEIYYILFHCRWIDPSKPKRMPVLRWQILPMLKAMFMLLIWMSMVLPQDRIYTICCTIDGI